MKRGRPNETERAQSYADKVFVRLARERSLAKMSAVFEVGKKKRPNPLGGKKLKGQQRSARPFSEILEEVAGELHISPRTLEGHFRKWGSSALSRIQEKISSRIRLRSKGESKQQLRSLSAWIHQALERGDVARAGELSQRVMQIRQSLTEVSRDKK